MVGMPGPSNASGRISFFSLGSLGLLAQWEVPGGEALAVPPVMTNDGGMLLVAGVSGKVWALFSSAKAAAAVGKTVGSLSYSNTIAMPPAAVPLPFDNEGCVFLGGDGTLMFLSHDSPPQTISKAACMTGDGDGFSQPPTLLSMVHPVKFLVMSNNGCVSTFSKGDATGLQTLWVSNGSLLMGGTAGGPPAFIPAMNRILTPVNPSGRLCCLDMNSTAGVPCSGWGVGGCSPLPPSQTPYTLSPLALSPITSSYHGGQAYTFDGGVGRDLWDANVGVGALATSTNATLPWRAPCGGGACSPNPPLPPLLVSSVGGRVHRNEIVLAFDGIAPSACGGSSSSSSTSPPSVICIVGLQVGDSGAVTRDDDDSIVEYSDDDGGVTLGMLWSVALPQTPPSSTTPLAFLPGTTLSITPQGAILIPTSGGIFTLHAIPAPPTVAQDYALLVGVVAGSVGAGIAGLIAACACVAWRRRLRAQRSGLLEEFEDDLDDEEYGELRGGGLDEDVGEDVQSLSSEVLMGEGGGGSRGGGGQQQPLSLQDGGGRRVFTVKNLASAAAATVSR